MIRFWLSKMFVEALVTLVIILIGLCIYILCVLIGSRIGKKKKDGDE